MLNERRRGRRAAPFAAWTIIVAALAGPTALQGQTTTYLDHDGLTDELRSLTGASDAASLRSVARTVEGREVWLVEIGEPGGTPLDERPAVLVVGNLEGDHLLGSALALETVRHLLTSTDEETRRVLAENTVYVFPRLNPDGAEAMFGSVRSDRRTNARPYDDDNDGRTDEDGPQDLNGDGLITLMRVADPSGAYMVHPDDPRLMKKADRAAGESGGWTLYHEGVDSDGDGFIAEDGPGGVDLDRNFQHAYPYWEADAGPHMVSEPETRALMDFVVEHRNVAAIVTFAGSDNLVTPPDARGALAPPATLDLEAFADASLSDVYETGVAGSAGGAGGGFFFFQGSQFRGAQPGRDNPPQSGQRPATTVAEGDREYFVSVSDVYRDITGIEKLGVHRAPEGAFFEFGYFQYGVPSFSTPGWGMPQAMAGAEGERDAAGNAERSEVVAGEPAEPGAAAGAPAGRTPPQGGRSGRSGSADSGTDATLLAALDATGIDAFVPWTEHAHPTLGTVEIGGFRPGATTNPPAAMLADIGPAHGAFVTRLADMLPKVGIAETEVTALGGGIYRVEASVENGGYFPTALEHGMTCRCVDPVTVQIQVPPEDLVTGDPKTATVDALPGSNGRESFTWIVRGSPGQNVEIRVLSQKGGRDAATVTLR